MNCPNKKLIIKSKRKTSFDLGNKILYQICEKHFNHNNKDEIIAKVWIIGRTYMTAVERRKKYLRNYRTSKYYENKVAPVFLEDGFNNNIKSLYKLESIKIGNLNEILLSHYFLTKKLNKISGLDKRSFSSKYLHFHFPKLFYIYDTYTLKSLRKYISKIPQEYYSIIKLSKIDKEYARFFIKCFILRSEIYKKYKIYLTPREIDNLLYYD